MFLSDLCLVMLLVGYKHDYKHDYDFILVNVKNSLDERKGIAWPQFMVKYHVYVVWSGYHDYRRVWNLEIFDL